MSGMNPLVDPGIYLLADHLDAALAAGEDLLAAELGAPADLDRAESGSSAPSVARFVNDLKRLEAAVAARVLQARRRAAELPRLDRGGAAIISLFQASTESALELVAHFTRLREAASFDAANLTPYAALRARGLLAADAAELPRYQRVTVSDAYLIGGLLPLGDLLNVVAMTLESLDMHYDLYDELSDERTAPAATEPLTGSPGEPRAATPPTLQAGTPPATAMVPSTAAPSSVLQPNVSPPASVKTEAGEGTKQTTDPKSAPSAMTQKMDGTPAGAEAKPRKTPDAATAGADEAKPVADTKSVAISDTARAPDTAASAAAALEAAAKAAAKLKALKDALAYRDKPAPTA